jgi:hypothetical protein
MVDLALIGLIATIIIGGSAIVLAWLWHNESGKARIGELNQLKRTLKSNVDGDILDEKGVKWKPSVNNSVNIGENVQAVKNSDEPDRKERIDQE